MRDATAQEIQAEIERGADIMVRSIYERTPLHFTALLGSAEAIIALIEAGENIEARDKDGKAPFDLAYDNDKLKGTDACWLLNESAPY